MRYPQPSARPEYFRLNPESPLFNGLVFANLGGGAGSTVYRDESAAGTNGTLTAFTGAGNTPSDRWKWDATLKRPSLTFNGSTTYVDCGTSSRIRPTGAASYLVWFNAASLAITNDFMGAQGPTGTRGPNFIVNTSNLLNFATATDANTLVSVTGATVVSANRWYHAAAVYTPSVSVKCYLNGVSDGTQTTGVPASTYQSNGLPFRVGERGDGSFFCNGTLSDPVVFSRALSDAELSALADPSNVDLRVGGVPLILPKTSLWAVGASLSSALLRRSIASGGRLSHFGSGILTGGQL